MTKALTAKAVEKMQPDPDRRLEIPDGLLPGLYLVVQPTGAKSWAVRFRASGKTAKLTLGRFPAIKLGKARELARDQFEAVAKGRDPAAEKRLALSGAGTITNSEKGNSRWLPCSLRLSLLFHTQATTHTLPPSWLSRMRCPRIRNG